ncbi:MAG: GspE/PulE family protein, partial [Acetanaerobacterium sp.]
SERDFMLCLEQRLRVEFVDLDNITLSPDAAHMIQESTAKKYTLIPVSCSMNTLTVAMSDPMNYYAVEDVRFESHCEIKTVLATSTQINQKIEQFFSQQHAHEAASDVNDEFFTPGELAAMTSEMDERIDSAPIVRLINSIVSNAIQLNASDVHIEASRNTTKVRLRIDGVLVDQMKLNVAAHNTLITRLKIMGGLNIAERRIPQDGRFEMSVDGKTVDIRLSILPTVTGEKAVIRVLGTQNTSNMTIKELGFSKKNLALFDRIIKSPHGIILVTGPTGSGKSTTLYAVLRQLSTSEVNLITVEDPVEYRMEAVNQVQVNPKAGLTFAGGLRSILRQDPDIIMIGEIRDNETAQIAIRAAITGHLVLSTLHTNDAVSAITRLVDMGVPEYLVASSVVGIAAQRLVKKICPNCRVQYQSSVEENVMLGLRDSAALYRGRGCPFCNGTGYKGRTAIHEVVVIDKAVRAMVTKKASDDDIRDYVSKNGTTFLEDNLTELVLGGITTTEELIKVTYSV